MLALAISMLLSAPVFAADQAANRDSETTIPVTISAAATTFDVTVPTSFPTSIDPDTGEATASGRAKIINNSSGSVIVSQIKVTNYGSWKLAAFSANLRNADVDSNLIGVAVKPVGGRNAGTGGTQLKTTTGSATEQILLSNTSAEASEWIIDAKNPGDTDELSILYDTKVSPVSGTIHDAQVASIVITLRWNK